MKNIIFTGGGSGGHVMPAIALIESLLKDKDYRIHYIGSRRGIERELIGSIPEITYSTISTGKLRRYFSFQNFLDLFKISWGLVESLFILFKFGRKNTLLFSTGGFVSVPPVVAARFLGMRVFIHEQTGQAGLANKISSYFADKVFISFSQSRKFFPEKKVIHSGCPLRDECMDNEIRTVKVGGVVLNDLNRPILFVTGGGNGSFLLNDLIRKNLTELKNNFFIVHQVGKSFIEEYRKLADVNYLPVDFIHKGIVDIYKLAEIIVSRSGAGTVAEFLALKKRTIFIPLKIAQRNEQYHNAMEAQNLLGSVIVREDELKRTDFMALLKNFKNHNAAKRDGGKVHNAKEAIISYIKDSL